MMRCRFNSSWSCSRFQGFGCSPIKELRELGSKRRETVCPLSTVNVEDCEDPPLVREDRGGKASGVSVVVPTAVLSSYAFLE